VERRGGAESGNGRRRVETAPSAGAKEREAPAGEGATGWEGEGEGRLKRPLIREDLNVLQTSVPGG